MTVPDRIAVIDKGKMVQVATPSEIYEQPNSRYVAEFIGAVNTIEGTVTETGPGGTKMTAPGLGLQLDALHTAATSVGSTAWFAIRPEKIRIERHPPADPTVNAAEGEVWDIGYLGDLSIFHVRLPSGETMKVSRANASRTVEDPISWDDKVWLPWSRVAGLVLGPCSPDHPAMPWPGPVVPASPRNRRRWPQRTAIPNSPAAPGSAGSR